MCMEGERDCYKDRVLDQVAPWELCAGPRVLRGGLAIGKHPEPRETWRESRQKLWGPEDDGGCCSHIPWCQPSSSAALTMVPTGSSCSKRSPRS